MAEGADLGIAHDGDADRCLAVDANGEIVDGDQILAMCAGVAIGRAVAKHGCRHGDEQLGLHLAMQKAGVRVVTTAVGDRYVLDALVEQGLSLGGEQSGHIVFMDAATTGDGRSPLFG